SCLATTRLCGVRKMSRCETQPGCKSRTGPVAQLKSPLIAGTESLVVTYLMTLISVGKPIRLPVSFRPIGSFGSKTRFLRRESVRVLCSMMPAITLQLRVKCFLCVIQGMRVGHLTSQQGNWRKEIFPAGG